VEYFYEIGLSYALIDQCEEAIPWLQKALEIDPNAQPAHEGMKVCGQE